MSESLSLAIVWFRYIQSVRIVVTLLGIMFKPANVADPPPTPALLASSDLSCLLVCMMGVTEPLPVFVFKIDGIIPPVLYNIAPFGGMSVFPVVL